MIGYRRLSVLLLDERGFYRRDELLLVRRPLRNQPKNRLRSRRQILPAQIPPPPKLQGPQQTKHYPILVIAHGNEPFWSLRLGMKGPERLDRVSYPPVLLEPSDVDRDDSGNDLDLSREGLRDRGYRLRETHSRAMFRHHG